MESQSRLQPTISIHISTTVAKEGRHARLVSRNLQALPYEKQEEEPKMLVESRFAICFQIHKEIKQFCFLVNPLIWIRTSLLDVRDSTPHNENF